MNSEFQRILHEAGLHSKGVPVPDVETQLARFKRRRILLFRASAAAVIAGLLLTLPFVIDRTVVSEQTENSTPIYIVDSYGNKVVVNAPGQAIEHAEKIGESTIRYEAPDSMAATLYIHTLIVPKGAHFSLMLNDGTLIRVNSGSSITYPANFPVDGDRTVELNYGEIFLDVAHDETRPFVVHTPMSETKVLGTKFNVQAYGSNLCNITLVEGSVAVKRPHDEWAMQRMLNPGENAAVTSDQIIVTQTDVQYYTAWIDGYYYYDKKSVTEILADICLRYDYHLEGPASKDDDIRFWFFRDEDMNDVMMRLGRIANTDIGIVGNRIILK